MDIDSQRFPWCIVYRTPYGDIDVLAVFTTETNAKRVCDVWLTDCKDDEDVAVVPTEEALEKETLT